MKPLTKEMCQALRTALQSTLDNHMADYSGMVIKVGSATFDATTVTFKVDVTPGGSEAVTEREREQFAYRCHAYGFREEQYGAKFMTPDRREFTVVGLAKRARTRPVLCRLSNGREFWFDSRTVQHYLAAKS